MGGCCCRNSTSPHPTVPAEFMDTLKTKTQLKPTQIQHLYNRFCQISGEYRPNQVQKYNFYSGLLSLNPLLPTILNCMFGEKNVITFVEFAIFLSTFQAHSLKTKRGVKNEGKDRKLSYLFNMYDHNKDGRITKVDLVIIVHKLFAHVMDHLQIMRIVDTMMIEMDGTDSNQISFNDFCKAFEVFDMAEMMVTFIPEFRGRSNDDGKSPKWFCWK
ncbi:calcineurin B homologous protein 3 isoform X2 [Drosophila guanche]|uniref:Blast:Calcineurin subunit B n=1 Tax=Drosophila guanche TaxID=7266 RepID=A0A3B0K1K1_DROGU|nr:calcineurin B homologous protein 3 isoform X2 [Drosophila guanche]SPP88114.1 blast:Calcineurin subunit B [Drosophila guanche]